MTKVFRNWFVVSFILFGVFFIGKLLWRNLTKDNLSEIISDWRLYSIALFFFVLLYIVKFCIWHLLSYKARVSIPYKAMFLGRAISEFGKYIPGKVWILSFLYVQYRKYNIDRAKLIECLYQDLVCQISAALFFFAYMVLLIRPKIGLPKFLLSIEFVIFCLIVLCILINPLIYKKILQWFKFTLNFNNGVSHRDMIFISHLYILPSIVFAAGLYFVCKGILPVMDLGFAIEFASIYQIASIIGMMALIIPGGLGVREAGALYLLSSSSEITEELLISLVFIRILLMFAELVLFIGSFIFLNRKKIVMFCMF